MLVSILATMLALELGLRASRPGGLQQWDNLVQGARIMLTTIERGRFVHDDRLGVVPRGRLRGNDVARDGEPGPGGGGPILAVGDSYTYGEEVADNETWPSHLERTLGRPVLNGGVSSYGFDQTVLRAVALADELRSQGRPPAAIVVSFIADDIRRTEMRRVWGAEKPYFDFAGDELALRNVPVPPPTPLTFWQKTLGYSHLFDFILRRLELIRHWFGDEERVHPVGQGERISCLLTRQLAELQIRGGGVPLLLLAQYDPIVWQDAASAAEQRRLTRGLLGCAADRGLATLDSYDALASRAGDARLLYVTWHMSAAGNRLIAELLAISLAQKLR